MTGSLCCWNFLILLHGDSGPGTSLASHGVFSTGHNLLSQPLPACSRDRVARAVLNQLLVTSVSVPFLKALFVSCVIVSAIL